MFWLLWRGSLGLLRDPFYVKVQLAQSIAIALLLGSIYLRLEYDQSSIQNMNGLLFLCISYCSFSTIFLNVILIPMELPIFLREHQNGMYRVFTYYFTKIIIDMPGFIVLPIMFITIVYWMANLNNEISRFVICALVMVLVVQSSLAFGTFISVSAPSAMIALAVAGPFLIPLLIFSGFLLNFDSIPKYFVWLRYLSWLSYANEILTVNQWSGVTNITCTSEMPDCIITGEDIMGYLNVDEDSFYFNIGLMFALIAFYRVIAFIILVIKAKSYSGSSRKSINFMF